MLPLKRSPWQIWLPFFVLGYVGQLGLWWFAGCLAWVCVGALIVPRTGLPEYLDYGLSERWGPRGDLAPILVGYHLTWWPLYAWRRIQLLGK
jgi:hypothetical protein